MSNVKGLDADVSSYITLRPYIGSNYAWLLFQLGYRSITDLTNVTFHDLSETAGLGPKRMAGIKRALEDRGLSFRNPKEYWVQNNFLEQIEKHIEEYIGIEYQFSTKSDSPTGVLTARCDSCASNTYQAERPPLRLVVTDR